MCSVSVRKGVVVVVTIHSCYLERDAVLPVNAVVTLFVSRPFIVISNRVLLHGCVPRADTDQSPLRYENSPAWWRRLVVAVS